MSSPIKAPHVFMIDNYDSFTFNLVQYFGELGAKVTVRRNDEITLADIESALALMDMATREHVHREDADFSFHFAIAVAADNHYLSSSLLGLRDHIGVVMTLHGKSLLASHPSLEDVFEEHKSIFTAIRDGDAMRATRLMEEHLIGSRDRLFGVSEHEAVRGRLDLSGPSPDVSKSE